MRELMNIVEAKDPKLRALEQEAFDDYDVTSMLAAFNDEAQNPNKYAKVKFYHVTDDIYQFRWLAPRDNLCIVRDDKIVAFLSIVSITHERVTVIALISWVLTQRTEDKGWPANYVLSS